MAAVTKVIQLPAPVHTRPAVERWGLMNLTVNPIAQTASITLVSVDEHGVMVPQGETASMGISGEQYTAAVSPLVDGITASLLALLLSSETVAEGTTVEDAT